MILDELQDVSNSSDSKAQLEALSEEKTRLQAPLQWHMELSACLCTTRVLAFITRRANLLRPRPSVLRIPGTSCARTMGRKRKASPIPTFNVVNADAAKVFRTTRNVTVHGTTSNGSLGSRSNNAFALAPTSAYDCASALPDVSLDWDGPGDAAQASEPVYDSSSELPADLLSDDTGKVKRTREDQRAAVCCTTLSHPLN